MVHTMHGPVAFSWLVSSSGVDDGVEAELEKKRSRKLSIVVCVCD